MKRAFTYKEYSLIAGILVAIVVALTLWVKVKHDQQPAPEAVRPRPAVKISDTAKRLVEKTFAEVGL